MTFSPTRNWAAKLLGVILLTVFMSVPLGSTAQAKVVASIDISSQRMKVTVNGRHYASWKVSTAGRGYRTPTGTWRPKWMAKMHYSRKYNNSPMPHSIFFYGGYAIHGTTEIRSLGRPASHGCVRLHPNHAKVLFGLVKANRAATRIRVVR